MSLLLLSRLKYVRCVSNQLVKWRVLLLLSLISLTFILITVFSLPTWFSLSPHRAKTKILFMNEELCTPSTPYDRNQRTAVIVIPSARKHFNRRSVIRQTYGSVKKANNVKILAVIFILAKSDGRQEDDEADDRQLLAEADWFGDVIIGDFVDSYRNLTLKTIMAYDWLTTYCRKAQFVIKTDDDTVVNIFELTEHLSSLSPVDVSSSNIWCCVDRNESTVSDVTSKFYASSTDFPSGKFPDHCSGIGYVTTFVVIERFVEDISKSFPGRVCTHEDVFMTAVVPMHINADWKYFWRKPEPIQLVHQKYSISCVFEDGRDDVDHFLRDFVRNTTMDAESRNFIKFRERYPKRFFFLIAHTEELEEIHLRLWEIIKKSY
ncbi:beta-1,3-galactosyltransferase 5-like [Bradysia coprophila]|uniref:beta-1,3-galactosyltransferase 5-like n=1 Tax=Bradysia coprophila TaxID=38358 RepID=UPI00187DB96B|nr:beta-1,3-galactosyltransferase 5-like [Bradysia coprophila]